MTGAELAAWQKRCGLRTDRAAAAALGMAAVTYRRKRSGRTTINQQTELLCAYYEVFAGHFETIAEAAERLARLTAMPIAPAAAERVGQVIAKVINQSTIC